MEEVIRKYFQCWLDKDADTVKRIFSDDIIYSECYGPVYKGIGQKSDGLRLGTRKVLFCSGI